MESYILNNQLLTQKMIFSIQNNPMIFDHFEVGEPPTVENVVFEGREENIEWCHA